MSIETEVSSMIENIKKDYKEIENLGATIPEDKNIENIASCLEEVYDNLPKTTGEDTTLSLTTIKGKMSTTLKGDTQQNGTPTPDTPIDIEVVTGTQEVKVENVNLLDVSSITTPITTNGITLTPKGNGTFELKGIATTANAGFTLGKCKFTNGTNYTMSNGLSDNAYGKYTMLIPTYAAWGNNTIITGTSTTFQAKSSEEFNIEMVIYNGTDISSGITIQPQLEKGSTATTYTPHQEQTQVVNLGDIELCKIGTAQDYLYKSNDKWYKKEYISKHILSTSDTWALNRSSNNLYQYRTKNDLLEDVITSPDPYSRPVALCNYYTKGDINGMTTQCFNIGGLKYIGITSDISTLANFNTFITNNSIYVYYVCQTPNDIEITNETLIEQLDNLEKMKSYNGTTNINCSGNLSAILGVSALKGE